jgi:hypothetical protein
MIYKTFRLGQAPPDLIIDGDVTYIKTEDKPTIWSGLWPGVSYERLEVVRAKGYDPDRTAQHDSSGRCGRPSGCSTHPGAGSDYHLFDESVKYEPKLGPPISESLWQASLYRNLIHGKDDGIRGWPA